MLLLDPAPTCYSGNAALHCVQDTGQPTVIMDRLYLHPASVIVRLRHSSSIQSSQFVKSADNAMLWTSIYAEILCLLLSIFCLTPCLRADVLYVSELDSVLVGPNGGTLTDAKTYAVCQTSQQLMHLLTSVHLTLGCQKSQDNRMGFLMYCFTESLASVSSETAQGRSQVLYPSLL